MNKTILVTGGTGFIGNCFCKLLLDERPEYRVSMWMCAPMLQILLPLKKS